MQNNCIICLEEIKDNDFIIKFIGNCNCKAIVHQKCGSEWLELNKVCIICKKEINNNEFKVEKFIKKIENTKNKLKNKIINKIQNKDLHNELLPKPIIIKNEDSNISIINQGNIIRITRNNCRHEELNYTNNKKICAIALSILLFILIIIIIALFYIMN